MKRLREEPSKVYHVACGKCDKPPTVPAYEIDASTAICRHCGLQKINHCEHCNIYAMPVICACHANKMTDTLMGVRHFDDTPEGTNEHVWYRAATVKCYGCNALVCEDSYRALRWRTKLYEFHPRLAKLYAPQCRETALLVYLLRHRGALSREIPNDVLNHIISFL